VSAAYPGPRKYSAAAQDRARGAIDAQNVISLYRRRGEAADALRGRLLHAMQHEPLDYFGAFVRELEKALASSDGAS